MGVRKFSIVCLLTIMGSVCRYVDASALDQYLYNYPDSSGWEVLDSPEEQLIQALKLEYPVLTVYGYSHLNSGALLFKVFSAFKLIEVGDKKLCISREVEFISLVSDYESIKPHLDVLRYPMATYLIVKGNDVNECTNKFESSEYVIVDGTTELNVISEIVDIYENVDSSCSTAGYKERSAIISIDNWSTFASYFDGDFEYIVGDNVYFSAPISTLAKENHFDCLKMNLP